MRAPRRLLVLWPALLWLACGGDANEGAPVLGGCPYVTASLCALWWGCVEAGGDGARCQACVEAGRGDCAGAAGASGEGGAGQAGTSGVGGSGGAAGLGGGGSGGSGGAGGVACTAPTTDCNGTCVDVTKDDAANCGACGRACLGTATCAAGACVPELMASGEVAPYALVDDGTSLYWVSPAVKEGAFIPHMRRVAKASAGGSAQDTFSSTIVRARSLGFDGTKLYWGDLGANPSDTANQRLLSAALTDVGPQLVEAGQAGIEHLTLGGGKVYWSLLGASAVRGKQADGTGPVAPEVFGQSNPRWVVVDADAVPYWVAVDAAGTGREVRRLATSSTAEPVASGPDVVAVELTTERFYWADRAAGTVQSRPKASPTEAPRDEFSGQGAVEGFAVVAEGTGGAAGAGGAAPSVARTLYVLTAQGQKLKAWRKGPDDEAPLLLGEVTTKAEPYGGNPFGAAYVLVDASYVYFADVGTFAAPTPDLVQVSAGNGVVYRVAK